MPTASLTCYSLSVTSVLGNSRRSQQTQWADGMTWGSGAAPEAPCWFFPSHRQSNQSGVSATTPTCLRWGLRHKPHRRSAIGRKEQRDELAPSYLINCIFGIFGARYFWRTSFNTRGVPLGHCGTGATRTRRRTNKKSPARRDGAWKVGGSNYESFSGFNLTWLMAFVGSEALRLTRVAESAA